MHQEATLQIPPVVPAEWVDIGRLIGAGSFKSVHAGTLRSVSGHHQPVAVLRWRRGSRSGGWPREAVAQMASNGHSFITALLGAAEDPAHGGWMLFCELCANGPLDAILEQRANEVTVKHKFAIAHQMAHAIAAVGASGFAHGDVAARNVLVFRLDEAGCLVKLTDFGSAVRLASTRSAATPKQLAIRWAPPELMGAQPLFSTATDVWSLGVLGWELFSPPGTVPYAAQHASDEMAAAAVISG